MNCISSETPSRKQSDKFCLKRIMRLVEYLTRLEVFIILFAYHIVFTAKIQVIFCKLDVLASVACNRTVKRKVNTGQNHVRFNEITYFLFEKAVANYQQEENVLFMPAIHIAKSWICQEF